MTLKHCGDLRGLQNKTLKGWGTGGWEGGGRGGYLGFSNEWAAAEDGCLAHGLYGQRIDSDTQHDSKQQ